MFPFLICPLNRPCLCQLQYNVTAEEYQRAHADYLRAVQQEEARQQFLAEVRYRNLYGDDPEDEDDDESSRDYPGDESPDDEDSEDHTPALAEYKFFSTKLTRPARSEYRERLGVTA